MAILDESRAFASRRQALSLAYRGTGVFQWGERAKRLGALTPVRALHLIAYGLTYAAKATLPGPAAGAQWIDECLETAWRRHAKDPAIQLEELNRTVQPFVAWDAREELAELMAVWCGPAVLRQVRTQFASKGLAVDHVELHDLSAVFAGRQLRVALSAFDPQRGEGRESAWLSTVFYRFALRHVILARRTSVSMDATFDAEQLPSQDPSPDEVIQQRVHNKALLALPRAIERLERKQREAVQLYFGLGCPEHTLAEVARALDTNIYFARSAVACGIGAIAGKLGVPGLLEGDELDVARLLFAEGHDPESAASQLGLPAARVRKISVQVGVKLRSALRSRTVSSETHAMRANRESTMESTNIPTSVGGTRDSSLATFVDAFIAARIDLTAEDGERIAHLGHDGPSWNVSTLLHDLRQQPDLLEHLLANSSPERLDNLYALSRSETRQDLMLDHVEWGELLNKAAANSRANAAALVSLWRAECERRNVAWPAELSDVEATSRVSDALSTVTSALEEEVPWQQREQGSAVLQISAPENGAVVAYWCLSPKLNDSPSLDLTDLLHDRFALIGRFDVQISEVLLDCTIRGLKEQTVSLPGFVPVKALCPERVAFEWHRP